MASNSVRSKRRRFAATDDSGISAEENRNMTAAQWWQVDLSSSDDDTRGATKLVRRCMSMYGWNEVFGLRVLEGYKVFMESKKFLEDWDATMLSPSRKVDMMWHVHLLNTKQYLNDCELLVGQFVHRNPYGEDEEAHIQRVTTMKNLVVARLGEDYDKVVWKFGSDHIGDTQWQSDESSSPASRRCVTRSRQVNPGDKITIRVRDQTGEETFFKIRKSTPLSMVFDVYAQRKGVPRCRLRFLLDGRTVKGVHDSAISLQLNDGDHFDAFYIRWAVRRNLSEDLAAGA